MTKRRNRLSRLADRLVLWNKLSMRRHWIMQTLIPPSFLGLIIERRRQKKRMREGF